MPVERIVVVRGDVTREADRPAVDVVLDAAGPGVPARVPATDLVAQDT